jgi:hypothetical protein
MPGDLKVSIERLEAKTKAGRLRSLMPMIEAKVRQGIRHVDIIRALNEAGFAISEYTYRSYLQRYRKKRAKPGKPSARQGTAPPIPAVAAEERSAAPQGGRPPTFDYDPRGIPELLK